MTLRCIGCDAPHPEHSQVCPVVHARALRAARERRRRLVWGVLVWTSLGVSLGFLYLGFERLWELR